MRCLVLVLFAACGGLLQAQPTRIPQFNGLVVFQNGDTLRGQVRVDVPVNRVYISGSTGGERAVTAADIKYVGLRLPRAPRQRARPNEPISQVEFIGTARTANYIAADCNGQSMLFEVIETGSRVVLLYHARPTTQRSAFWMTDPWTAQLRKDWLDPPSSGFYLGDLTTNRIVPFRCSLPGLLRVLPYYHLEMKHFAWQNPTLTVRGAIAYYNSLSPPAYYEAPKMTIVREKGR